MTDTARIAEQRRRIDAQSWPHGFPERDFDAAEAPLPSAASILEAGLGHMRDRAATYDKGGMGGERSIGATVQAFQAITGDGRMDTAERGWLFMCLLKCTRAQQGEVKLDNYEDLAAYAGLMGESAMSERSV